MKDLHLYTPFHDVVMQNTATKCVQHNHFSFFNQWYYCFLALSFFYFFFFFLLESDHKAKMKLYAM